MTERKVGKARRDFTRMAAGQLRQVRRSVVRRRVRFVGVPGRGASRVEGGRFGWEADGPDAVLELVPETGTLPSGWVELSLTLETEDAEAASPVLQVDAGGASAAVSIRLPMAPDGRVRALVRLPDAARALRLGPVTRRTRFRIADARAVELGQAEATLRMAWPLALRLLREPERIGQVARRYMGMLRSEGLRGLDGMLGEKSRGQLSLEHYEDWIRQYETLTDAAREELRGAVAALPYQPLVSVVMPTYNTPAVWLRRALDSVRAQLYPHWELCIADDASPSPEVRQVLEEYAHRDERIRFVVRPENGHISAASNSALELVRGEFVALLDHDDELSVDALARVVEELNAHPDADIVFSDEDKLDTQGHRYDPYFKPEWNLDLFRSQNLISHLGVYRTERLREVGGFRRGFEGSQDYDLALRVVERTTPERIRHIPRVLYHWRAIPGSTALDVGEKDYASTAARRALQEHLDRTASGARIEPGPQAALHRARYPLPSPLPAVTVILQTRGGADASPRQQALRLATDYPTVEWRSAAPAASPSEAANLAAREARGEVLVFLDADLEPQAPGWLAELVSHALRPEVGAVGAKLCHADGTVEHAGLVLGMGPEGLAGYPHRGLARAAPGHVGRAVVIQQFSAVSASCLAVRRAHFEAVGGFDAEHLPDVWRDVDLCLRLRERGLRTVWTPYAELTWRGRHGAGQEEGDSRVRAGAWLQARWGETLRRDPFHSPNHALDWEDLRLAWPPRVRPSGGANVP
ncbi:glycosyltransferase [Pyxidicoccus fallax]|uniref:Glycosyltransferase n=1 Tax=Pyxidicoccus fallax TaxID=394095 RepID=A0A848LRU6_9BACT|nr:glycosyltransferase [Pyxidicoccus fallax]NMO20389.1 glycosyltransferase [Pyxidicoccus fallax]NPC81129.1 glycosyltransferase [Pyxidicoccus fallax]